MGMSANELIRIISLFGPLKKKNFSHEMKAMLNGKSNPIVFAKRNDRGEKLKCTYNTSRNTTKKNPMAESQLG